MNIKQFALVTLVVVALGSVANAQVPAERKIGHFSVDSATNAPLQLVKRVNLDAKPERVFRLLENYEAMPKWLPVLTQVDCDRSNSRGKNGIGTKRVCSLANGVTIKESIVGYETGELIAYSVSGDNSLGLSNHLAIATTEPNGEGGTLLTWRQYFDHSEPAKTTAMVNSMMEEGFQNLVRGYGGGTFETAFGLDEMKVSQRLVVDATPSQVWSVLGRDFAGVSKWASFVPHAKLSKSADGGTVRLCSTPLGNLREAVTRYDESARELEYRVEAGLPPVVAQAANNWKVMPTGDGNSTVLMTLDVDLVDGTPSAIAEGVRDNLAGVTRNFVEELRYYVENDHKPHPRKVAAEKR